MPFAVQRRRVTSVGEQLRNRVLPGCHSRFPSERRNDRIGAGADRMTPGHDGRAGWGTLHFNVVVVEADALARQLVDPWCGRCATVNTEITPTDVIDEHEHDIRPLEAWASCLCACGQKKCKREDDQRSSGASL